MQHVMKIMRRLAQPDIIFWALPWLMLLLTLGTVAQRDMGLYAAQKTFFSSWLLWVGPLPLPGGYMTIALIGIALACKFFIASKWSWRDAGIILSHSGALLLLCGGLLTAWTAREGFIMIAEGTQQHIIEDYLHKNFEVTDADGRLLLQIPHDQLKPGQQHKIGNIVINILEYCHNCEPAPRTEKTRGPLAFIGPAAQIKMTAIKPDLNEEANHSAITLAIRGSKTDQDGIYLLTDIMPHEPEIDGYQLRFGRVKTVLPFTIELKDVRRELYPGTQMPRGYESAIIVHDGPVNWPALIRMNEPLRYKGYTLYQSNYVQMPDGQEASVFSVVKNSGWLFPYIASLIITAGLAWHLILALPRRRKQA